MSKRRSKGDGSVRQLNSGKWRVTLYIDGKRPSKSGFETEREALEWKRKELSKVDQGFDYFAGKITLDEYMNQWFEVHKNQLRDSTIYQYQRIMKSYIIPYLGKYQLNNLKSARIGQHYAELVKEGVGLRTIGIVHAVLHVALKDAVRNEYIVKNHASGVRVPKREKPEMKVWKQGDVMQFLIAAQISPYYALYHLAVMTGMRQGELLGLQWSDLDWIAGTIQIKRQVSQLRGRGWQFTPPKTHSGRRSIRLWTNVLDVLKDQKEHIYALAMVAGKDWKDHDLIFPSSVGTPINPSNLRKDFKEVIERAGIERIRFHDLRHTAASLMLNNGIPTIIVSKMIGHSRPSTTMDIYGHLIPGMQDEAAKMMDEITTLNTVDMSQKEEVKKIKEEEGDSYMHIYAH